MKIRRQRTFQRRMSVVKSHAGDLNTPARNGDMTMRHCKDGGSLMFLQKFYVAHDSVCDGIRRSSAAAPVLGA